VVIKSSAPVVPIRVFGTFEAYGRHLKIPRPYRVMVKFGKPMDFAALRAEAKACSKTRLKAIYQQVSNEIMDEIAKLQPCEDKASFP
jgi:1-acyl-sn-glycerol-3-phosphate acyltransferase